MKRYVVFMAVLPLALLTSCGETKPPAETGEVFELPSKAPVAAEEAAVDDGEEHQTESPEDYVFVDQPYYHPSSLPKGARIVRDEATGEVRYRVPGQQVDDPRTYTYEQLMDEVSDHSGVGMESYDAQDVQYGHVEVSNREELLDFYDDGYLAPNLHTALANYMYYFTQDPDTKYTSRVMGGSAEDGMDGLINFDVVLDYNGGELPIHCEYNPLSHYYGFVSDIGDMSLDLQYSIAKEGKKISRKTLLEKQPKSVSANINEEAHDE